MSIDEIYTQPDPRGPPRQAAPDAGAGGQARLRRLVSATQAVADELTLPDVYRRTAESARALVDAQHVALGALGPDGTVLQLVQLDAGDAEAQTVASGVAGLAGLTDLMTRLEPGRVSRFASAELTAPLPGSWADGLLAVPVHYRSEAVAVLLLSAPSPSEVRREDDDALLTLATTAGIAVENARLYDKARRRQEAGRLAAELSLTLLDPSGHAQAHRLVTQAAQQLVGADLVVWWHAAGEAVEALAAAGADSAAYAGLEVPRAAFSPATSAGVVATLSRTGAEPAGAVTRLLRRSEIEDLLLLPVGGTAGSRGWLMCGLRGGTTGFTDLDLDIGDVFMIQMSMALDLAVAQAAQGRVHLLEDRERIARDLHDNVIQSLFAVGLSLTSAGSLPAEAQRQERLDAAVTSLDDAIRQLRATIKALNADDDPAPRTLRATVLEVVHAATPHLGFRADVTFDGPVDSLTSQLLVAEIRAVLREAVMNVARHAAASRLSIYLVADGRTLSLVLVDNGIGLGTASRGSGLDDLRLRAELLDGELVLAEAPGGGLSLRWAIPLVAGQGGAAKGRRPASQPAGRVRGQRSASRPA